MADHPILQLRGRVFIRFDIRTLSGMLIGASDTGIEIGGVDKAVIRNPLTNEPYIPGSSLRGKMRSGLEKQLGLPQDQRINQGYIHSGKIGDQTTVVGHIFGVTGDKAEILARLTVRDVYLNDDSRERLAVLPTGNAFTEIKTEVAIDRVTAKASPRTIERVPAGAVFGRAEMVFNLYRESDVDLLAHVITALQLVEDDALGAGGSRGSGKVAFEHFEITGRAGAAYDTEVRYPPEAPLDRLADLQAARVGLLAWVRAHIAVPAQVG